MAQDDQGTARPFRPLDSGTAGSVAASAEPLKAWEQGAERFFALEAVADAVRTALPLLDPWLLERPFMARVADALDVLDGKESENA